MLTGTAMKIKLLNTTVDGRELTNKEQELLMKRAEDELSKSRKTSHDPISFGPMYGHYWQVFRDGWIRIEGMEDTGA